MNNEEERRDQGKDTLIEGKHTLTKRCISLSFTAQYSFFLFSKLYIDLN